MRLFKNLTVTFLFVSPVEITIVFRQPRMHCTIPCHWTLLRRK